MSGELPSEMIFALIFLVITGAGMALAWVVFQRLEARSQGRERRRSGKLAVPFPKIRELDGAVPGIASLARLNIGRGLEPDVHGGMCTVRPAFVINRFRAPGAA